MSLFEDVKAVLGQVQPVAERELWDYWLEIDSSVHDEPTEHNPLETITIVTKQNSYRLFHRPALDTGHLNIATFLGRRPVESFVYNPTDIALTRARIESPRLEFMGEEAVVVMLLRLGQIAQDMENKTAKIKVE